jgi:hypothetical protein
MRTVASYFFHSHRRQLPLPWRHHPLRRKHRIGIHINNNNNNNNNAITKIRRPSDKHSSSHRRLSSIGYDGT